MATSTTNFGLTKPAYNEAADVAVINGNMDTVDTVMGVNRNLAKGAQAGLAIVADGDTHAAITAGQYVYVRNNTHSLAEGLYVASANVSANGNITGSNMTAVSGGGLNALNSNKANKAGINWATTLTVNCPNTIAFVLVNNTCKIQVWLGGSTDINVWVQSINNGTVYNFVKSGSNSITFGEISADATGYTIARNGNSFTLTRASNASMVAFT